MVWTFTGVKLVDDLRFCLLQSELDKSCLTKYTAPNYLLHKNYVNIDTSSVLYAVKTFHKNHETRSFLLQKPNLSKRI